MRLVGAVLSLVGVVVIVIFWPGSQFDFVYDWLVAGTFIKGGDPYRPLGELAMAAGLEPGSYLTWIHPRLPGALVLQAPIGWIPFEWVYIAGRTLTALSAFFFAWVVARLLGRESFWFLLFVPALLVVWPFSTVLERSQVGFLVAALVGLTWVLGNRWSAGMPLAVAVTLKLWPWLLIPALWLSGRTRAASGAVAGLLSFNLVGLAFPHVSLGGVSRMLVDATGLQSVAMVPSWQVGMALGVLGLLVISFAKRPYFWAIPVALITAPVLWLHYLPALLLCAGEFRSNENAVHDVRESRETPCDE